MARIRQFRVYMAPAAGDRLNQTLYSGHIGQGPVVDEFETRLARYLGAPEVVTVNSGTSALLLALQLIGGGGSVLTSPLTCFATTAAILNAGFEPAWVDVDPRTCNMDLRDLRRQFEIQRPEAIMVVHYGGNPVDLDAVHEIADGVPVIEDCAHAFGSRTGGGHVGCQHGHYGCFSFQAIKTLTTGDGGALVPPPDQVERARRLRWFGLDRGQPRSGQDIQEYGGKLHMNDLAASIGLANLEAVDDNLRIQRQNAEYYRRAIPDLCLPVRPGTLSSSWLFPIQVGDARSFDKAMAGRDVETGLGHDRNDMHRCVARHRRPLPGLDYTIASVSCIPCGWWIGPAEREFVVDCIKKGY